MSDEDQAATIALECAEEIYTYEIDNCCGDSLDPEGMERFIQSAIDKACAEKLARLAQAFESIHNAIVFGSKDWSVYSKDAWIYGIVVGWDDSEGEATREICQRHKIKPEDLARMRSMHRVVTAAREALPEEMCPINMARKRDEVDGKTTTD